MEGCHDLKQQHEQLQKDYDTFGSFVAFAALQPAYKQLEVEEDLSCLAHTTEGDEASKELRVQFCELCWVRSSMEKQLVHGQCRQHITIHDVSYIWRSHDDDNQCSLLQKYEELTREMELCSAFAAESNATIARLQHALVLAKQVIFLS